MKKYISTLLFLLLMGIISGCEDFLEVEVPKDQVDQIKIFNDDRTAISAMSSVYSQLRNGGFLSGNSSGAGLLLGCYTDEVVPASIQNTDYRSFYDLSVLSTNTAVAGLWEASYKQIFAVNSLIEGIDNSEGMSISTRNQLKGEALTIRAVIHFYLTQTYGSIPYVFTTNYKQNSSISKLSSEKILNLALDDLTQAKELIQEAYPSVERVRINKAVVQGFLARMYLYQGNWESALEHAQELIENTDYELDNVNEVFYKESKEAIWQLKPQSAGYNTNEANVYIYQSLPAPFVKLSLQLYEAFEEGDLRKSEWIGSVDDANFFAFKYKFKGMTSPSREYSIVLRLAEMYLIAAEASARQGNWQQASNFINKIRNRAGLEDISVTGLQNALDVIIRERRLEFFCEFGHRFYDLKRLGRLAEMAVTKPQWKPYFELLPLPERELLLNKNMLPQNEGY